MLHRRDLLKLSALGGLASLTPRSAAFAQTPAKARTRIVFLGTKGGPRIGLGRSNPANLIMVNDTPIVLDCGAGVSHQLVAAKVPLQSIKYILLSHLHSDHDLDYGNLAYNAWATGLKTPIHAFGPKGTEAMTKAYWEVNKFDIETRIADEGRPDLRKLLIAKDIDADGVVLKTDDVTVTAFRTPHPPIVDNFAYKFETPDGVIVFSSDTEYNPKLAEFAKGADVLVHEALYVPGIAAIAQPKLLVLSHLVPGDNDSITDEQWLTDVRKHFTGKAIVAKDLMEVALPLPV